MMRHNWSVLVVVSIWTIRTIRSIRVGSVSSLWMLWNFTWGVILPMVGDVIVILTSPVNPLKLVYEIEQSSLAWITVEIDIRVTWYITRIAIDFYIILSRTIWFLHLIHPYYTLYNRCHISHELPLLRLSQFSQLLIIPQLNIMLIRTFLISLNKFQFLQPEGINLIDNTRSLLYTGFYLMPAR